MILFLNEDRAYLSWVSHHRRGFVLDGKRKPRLARVVLHRATCPAIKTASSRRAHWTTGAKLKACSLSRDELQAWLTEQTETPVQWCPNCRPEAADAARLGGEMHPSKLAREILDYVLDAAVIHLEHEYPPYRLTVGDIAACFAKTPGQLAAALRQLSDEGLLFIPQARVTTSWTVRQVVFPTAAALKTLDAFRKESDAAIQTEVAKLQTS
jgi:hypothetical protein